jgi:hypothetical protein
MAFTAESAAIFRITHIDNVDWDLKHGLQCRSSSLENPNFRNIGNLDLIGKRKNWIVPIPPRGTLSDYVPFYFTPRSPMLYNIRTGHNGIVQVPMKEIVIYGTSLRSLDAEGIKFVFTNQHAKLVTAEYFDDLEDLKRIDWSILANSDFKYDPTDPRKMDRYQAEALIHQQLPCSLLGAIVCYNESAKSRVEAAVARRKLDIPVIVRPAMFFG